MPSAFLVKRLLLYSTSAFLLYLIYRRLISEEEGRPLPVSSPLSRRSLSDRLRAESCRLPDVDPWDPTLKRFLNPNDSTPNHDQFSPGNCTPTFVEATYFENGRLGIRPEFADKLKNCEYMCLLPVSDQKYERTEPVPITDHEPMRPECDIFEVRCRWRDRRRRKEHGPYWHLYTQIYEPRKTAKPQNNPPLANAGYDVHVIILDSLAHSQMIRSMPRTVNLLLREFDAIPFWHANKVAQNSWPNGMAILYGMQVYDIYRSPVNDFKPADVPWKDLCYKFVDDVPELISHQFKEAGYKTMWAEDWSKGVLSWDCEGMNRTLVDHDMRSEFIVVRPFQLRVKNGDPGRLPVPFYKDRCRERHSYLLDYLRQFLNAYGGAGVEGKRKFSFHWNIFGHDHVNSFYHIDDEFFDFFHSMKAQLRRSFVFFMGDHGLRFTDIRDTPLGAIEDANPALFMLLPEELRQNERLRTNLRRNSHLLVTHYALYATLLTIAKESHKWTRETQFGEWDLEGLNCNLSGFKGPRQCLNLVTTTSKPSAMANQPASDSVKSRLHGSSLLHPHMKQPRNCATLRIPFIYCQCQYQLEELFPKRVEYAELAVSMALEMVERMNTLVAGQNLTKKCATLQLSPSQLPLLEEFEPRKAEADSFGANERVFRLTVVTEPGGGKFWDYASVAVDGELKNSSTISFFSTYFTRVNAYGPQTKCVVNIHHMYQPYCYCRDQTEEAQWEPGSGGWWGGPVPKSTTPLPDYD